MQKKEYWSLIGKILIFRIRQKLLRAMGEIHVTCYLFRHFSVISSINSINCYSCDTKYMSLLVLLYT